MNDKFCFSKKKFYLLLSFLVILVSIFLVKNLNRPLRSNTKASEPSCIFWSNNKVSAGCCENKPVNYCASGLFAVNYSVDCKEEKYTTCPLIGGCDRKTGLCRTNLSPSIIPTNSPTPRVQNKRLLCPTEDPNYRCEYTCSDRQENLSVYFECPYNSFIERELVCCKYKPFAEPTTQVQIKIPAIQSISNNYTGGIIISNMMYQTILVGNTRINEPLFTLYFIKEVPYFRKKIDLVNSYVGSPIGHDVSYYTNKKIEIKIINESEKEALLKKTTNELLINYLRKNDQIFKHVRFLKVSINGEIENADALIVEDFENSVGRPLLPDLEEINTDTLYMTIKVDFETGTINSQIGTIATSEGFKDYSLSCLIETMETYNIKGDIQTPLDHSIKNGEYRFRPGNLFIRLKNQKIISMEFGFVNGNSKPFIDFSKLDRCIVYN